MTFDPYENRVPFGLLTDDEKAALKAHHGPVQFYIHHHAIWELIDNPIWAHGTIYRAVRPAPELLWIAPEVWRVLDPKWQWAAADKSGSVWVYQGKPKATSSKLWVPDDACQRIDETLAPHLIRRGAVPWDKSLIQRPDGV